MTIEVFMSNPMFSKAKKSIELHEGKKNFPYVDTVGKITIGVGYNLTDRGLDDKWIESQFKEDVHYFYTQLHSTFPWYADLNEDRQLILLDMCFMGWKRFLEFEKMITALSKGDYKEASEEMLNSEWAKQTKSRAEELARGMLSGVYDI